MADDLPTSNELRDLDKISYALRVVDLPNLERMIEIIEAQKEEIDRLTAELARVEDE